MTARVSLAMLAEKDSPTLSRCLASVADLVDEIVVVTQPGASDHWKNAAASFGATLVEFPWCDDFSAARNESLRHVSGDWSLCLDADEWLDNANREALRSLLGTLPSEAGGFGFDQLSSTAFGRSNRIRQVRLFRHTVETRWSYRVFEQVVPSLKSLGPCLPAGIEIQHDGYHSRPVVEAKRHRNARLLQRSLAELPNDSYLLFCAGRNAYEMRNWSAAVAFLDQSRRLRSTAPFGPPPGELYATLARACVKVSNPQAAMSICHEGRRITADRDPELLFVQAALRIRTGDHVNAEPDLIRCLDLQPQHGPAWQLMANLLMTTGRLAETEEIAAVLGEIPGMAVEAAAVRARLRLTLGESGAACQVLEAALQDSPNAMFLHEMLANIRVIMGDRAGAEGALHQVLRLDPNHPWAQQQLYSRMAATA